MFAVCRLVVHNNIRLVFHLPLSGHQLANDDLNNDRFASGTQEQTSWSGWGPTAGRGRRAGTARAPRPRTCASRSSCSSPSRGGSAPRGSRSSSPGLRREECLLSCIEVCDIEEFSLMMCHNFASIPGPRLAIEVCKINQSNVVYFSHDSRKWQRTSINRRRTSLNEGVSKPSPGPD